jgi:deoxyadenosine/deoxycytidine kinase
LRVQQRKKGGMQRYVVVEGNIGAGKSTLLKHLKEMGFWVVPEPVEHWCSEFEHMGERHRSPLEIYYGDSSRYSLAFNVIALASRVEQMRQAAIAGGRSVLVMERDPFDTQLFVEQSRAAGDIRPLEHKALTDAIREFSGLLEFEKAGAIYLRLSPDQCVERIRTRSRAQEAGLTESKVLQLGELHDAKYAAYEGGMRVLDARESPEACSEKASAYILSVCCAGVGVDGHGGTGGADLERLAIPVGLDGTEQKGERLLDDGRVAPELKVGIPVEPGGDSNLAACVKKVDSLHIALTGGV